LCFVFSSRRRHTRCLSDWSSDVCSSDLNSPVPCPLETRDLRLSAPNPSVRAGRRGQSCTFFESVLAKKVRTDPAPAVTAHYFRQIGRASCRERVETSAVVVASERQRQ